MAKIAIVSCSKTKLKIQLSPKLTKNQFHRNIQSKLNMDVLKKENTIFMIFQKKRNIRDGEIAKLVA